MHITLYLYEPALKRCPCSLGWPESERPAYRPSLSRVYNLRHAASLIKLFHKLNAPKIQPAHAAESRSNWVKIDKTKTEDLRTVVSLKASLKGATLISMPKISNSEV